MLLHDNDFLLGLLKTMNIPEARLKDVNWLIRNLPIRNSQHPNFTRAMTILIGIAKG